MIRIAKFNPSTARDENGKEGEAHVIVCAMGYMGKFDHTDEIGLSENLPSICTTVKSSDIRKPYRHSVPAFFIEAADIEHMREQLIEQVNLLCDFQLELENNNKP
jgi:hypothetical protein